MGISTHMVLGMRRSMLAGALVGVVVTAGVATATTRPVSILANGLQLYEEVQRAAAAGDVRAQEQLTAIDAYLATRDLGPEGLTLPTGAESNSSLGKLVELRIEDHAPWRLDITNSTTFESDVDLEAYRSVRHASLDSLAEEPRPHDPRGDFAPRSPGHRRLGKRTA